MLEERKLREAEVEASLLKEAAEQEKAEASGHEKDAFQE